jgi:hypothetical protein
MDAGRCGGRGLGGVLVAVQSKPVAPVAAPPHANASALTMVPAAASTTLASTASISSYAWATGIELTCSYAIAPEKSDRDGDEPGDKLVMVVVGRDGSHTRLATWVALTDVTATPGGSTSMPFDQIATVQIVSADDGGALLQRNVCDNTACAEPKPLTSRVSSMGRKQVITWPDS